VVGPGKEYDVIVIGGGIHGLTVAAYLQKAGLKVAVFERRLEAGAGCCTEELMHPGVRANLCACLIGTMWSPAYDDLELERFGLEMLTSSEWSCFHPINRDKSAVLLHHYDARKQYEAWRRISEKDAELFRRLSNYFAPFWSNIMGSGQFRAQTPEGMVGTGGLLAGCSDIPRDFMDMTAMEMVDLMYEDERIKTAIHAWTIMSGTHPWEKRISAIYPIMTPFLMGPICSPAYTPRGGSHAVTHALARCFTHYGGKLLTGCPVQKIIVDDGEAKGVALSKDAIYPEAEIKATRAIVSDLSCRPTFIDLIGPDKLPLWVTLGAMMYDYDDVILFTNYWVLKEPLQWPGYPPEVERAFAFNFGVESPADVERLSADLAAGRLSDPPIVAGATLQGFAMADPTQAPPGQYTVMAWANVNYDLRRYGGPEKWDDIREEYGDKIEDLLNEYAPNLKKAKIARYCATPLDIYRRNPSMIKGSATAGAQTLAQFGANKPFPGCGAPRTPIGKLYISNSISPFPTAYLACGYIAASVLAEDLGVRQQDWWVAKAIEPGLKVLKRRGIEPRWSVD
jgi:phytoene dehydrogenase-like protein